MSIFSRLFESEQDRTSRVAAEAKKNAEAAEEEQKNREQERKNSFWLLVAMESGMSGDLGAMARRFQNRFAAEEPALLAAIDAAAIASVGMDPREAKALIGATLNRLASEVAARAKEPVV